jgi:hypothetical protein
LGREVLPMGTAPTTHLVTEVRFGPDERIEAHYRDGVRQPLERGAYAALVAEMAARGAREGEEQDRQIPGAGAGGEGDPDRISVAFPAPILRHLTFLDTPGLNDPDNVQVEIIYDLLPRCDVALFVLDSSFALSLSERAIIGDKLLRSTLSRLVFVMNKADQLDGREDERQVLERATALLEPLLGRPPLLLPYSAREALHGSVGGRNAALFTLLTEELPAGQTTLLLASARAKAADAARALAELLAFRRERLTATVAELDAELAVLRGQEEAMQVRVGEAMTGLGHRLAALRDDYLAGLRGLANGLNAGLPDELRPLDLGDVRRYLPFYIQDTFRWHLEDTLPALREKVEAACADAAREVQGLLPQLPGGLMAPIDTGAYPLGGRPTPDLWDQGLVISVFVGMVGLVLSPLLASALLIGGPAVRLFSLHARQAKERETLIEDARKSITTTADAVAASVTAAFSGLEAEIRGSVDGALTAQVATVRAALEELRARRAAGEEDAQARGAEIAADLAVVAAIQERAARPASPEP